MKRKRITDYLKTGILLLGISVLLWNCEKEEILKVPLEKNKLETISITEAKELFEEFNNEKKNLLSKGSKEQFMFDPLWETIKQEGLSFSEAQLTNLNIKPKIKLNYKPKLFFIKVNGYNIKAFETTIAEEAYDTGEIKKGFVYYHSIEGGFMTGFRVEKGRIISRLKQKQKLNQAGFLSFFFQQCDGTEMNIGDLDGGVFDEVTIYGSLKTMEQFMSGYNKSGDFHPSQMGQEGGSGNGFGGGGSGDIDNIDDDPVNCPAGKVKDSNGNCVKKPCIGDPVKNPEIVSSGPSGKKGGTFGCTRSESNRICGGVKGKKKHDGLDIKAAVNTFTFSMYDGTVSSVRNTFSPRQYKEGSYGNYIIVTTKVNGVTIFIKYNHLNKVDVKKGDKVKAGDIIGLNGNTGNANPPKGSVIPHIHLQIYNTSWKSINPENYLKTKFDNNKNTINNTNC